MGRLSVDGAIVWRHEAPPGRPAAVMDAASWAAIVGPITTLLGGVGGYALAGRNDDRRDRRAAAREAAARREAFAERLEEERHTFQRETLLALQDELQRLIRITARISLQDQRTLKAQGQLYQLPPGMSEEEMEIVVAVQRLRSRIVDDGLRDAITRFADQCTQDARLSPRMVRLPPDEAITQLQATIVKLSLAYGDVVEMLGTHLRRELDRRYLMAELPHDPQLPGGRP